MGVEWEVCNKCQEAFPDVDYYVYCNCGLSWCSNGCAKEDGYEKIEGEDFYETSCNFCRQEDFPDLLLLNHALKILKTSRKDLINDLIEDRKLKE